MAGRHSSGARPSSTTRGAATSGRRSAAPTQPRVFAGTALTVDGVTRDAMGAASLLGSSIPKGVTAALKGADHAQSAYELTESEADAQSNVAGVLAGIDAISRSRQLRAVARNAEGAAPSAERLEIDSPRLLATGRGPLASVLGMNAGDTARAVAMFDRYGYTINRAMVPPRLDPMTARSYWQTEDTTVLGNMPAEARADIAAAFERGVTIWTDVAQIGTHAVNTPRAGVAY